MSLELSRVFVDGRWKYVAEEEGSGEAFNGGTITENLIVDAAFAVNSGDYIEMSAGSVEITSQGGNVEIGTGTSESIYLTAPGGNLIEAGDFAGTLKIGFFGKAPVARPSGVAVTPEAIHAALVSLGLITA